MRVGHVWLAPSPLLPMSASRRTSLHAQDGSCRLLSRARGVSAPHEEPDVAHVESGDLTLEACVLPQPVLVVDVRAAVRRSVGSPRTRSADPA